MQRKVSLYLLTPIFHFPKTFTSALCTVNIKKSIKTHNVMQATVLSHIAQRQINLLYLELVFMVFCYQNVSDLSYWHS